jgi:GT2 family glycosyltransferase
LKVVRVAFSAFSFSIIRRDVVELIEFGHNPMGVDTVFFQACLNNGVPTYADLTTEMLHMKGMEDNSEMRNVIEYAMKNNVNTKVNTNQLNPPKREEIFLPKQIT